MKNFLIALIACLLTGALTFFGLGMLTGNGSFSAAADTEVVEGEGETEEDEEGEDEEGEDEEGEDEEGEDEEGEDEEGEDEEGEDEEGEDEEDDDETADSEDDEDGEEEETKVAKKTPAANSASGFDVDLASILSDYKKWSAYNDENIELSYEFAAYDEDGSKITKKAFLEKQKTGEYIPVKGDGLAYKLVKLGDDEKLKKIKRGARNKASTALYYFKQEGRDFPNFAVKDLNGTEFSKAKAKGKLLVVKCWFVRCTICVKEFPELNEIYDKYEGNDKIEFLSFAFDKEEPLKKFLAKKEFRYPVIPSQQNFVQKEVKAKQFPLHVVIDKNGKILKMVNTVHALEHFIEKEIKG